MVNPTTESSSSALEAAAMDMVSTNKSNTEPIESNDIINGVEVNSISNGSTVTPTQSSNGVSPVESEPVAGSTTDTKEPSIGVVNNMAENTSTESSSSQESASAAKSNTKPFSNVSAVYGNYDDYQLLPEAPWPAPIFVRQDISPQERYYIEHRWYSQWSFFDSKASQNKNRYYRTQLIVGLGSVTVPVLVGINATDPLADTALYIITVVISLAVAMSTAIESLYTYGDNWRSYRSAAEDLHQEKSLYDVKAGRYMNNPQAFLRFVERCEEIIAQQNGRWVQSQEKAAEQAKDQGEDFLTEFGTTRATDQYGNRIAEATTTVSKTTSTTFAEPEVPNTPETDAYLASTAGPVLPSPTETETIDPTLAEQSTYSSAG